MIQIIFLLITVSYSLIQKSEISCNNAYCSACNETKHCSSCIEGYLLINNECKFMRNEHCNKVYQTSTSQTICTECLNGYKMNLKTGICEQGKETCSLISYDEWETKSLVCHKYECKEKQIQTNNGCIDCSSNIYCEQLDVTANDCSNCKTCKKGTKKVNGKCEIIDNYCQTFDTNEKCTKWKIYDTIRIHLYQRFGFGVFQPRR